MLDATRRMPAAHMAALAVLAGCASAPPLAPCEQETEAGLDLVPSPLEFGTFTDGGDVEYGNPPQGGAPYSPFRARAGGFSTLDEGAVVDMWGTDLDDGSNLGEVTYEIRFVCANVGESAGQWLASDLHFRYFGWALEDLAGRTAEISVRVSDLDGNSVEQSLVGRLVEMQ